MTVQTANPQTLISFSRSAVAKLIGKIALEIRDEMNAPVEVSQDEEMIQARAKQSIQIKLWSETYLRQIWDGVNGSSGQLAHELMNSDATAFQVADRAFCRDLFKEIASLSRGKSKNLEQASADELTDCRYEKAGRVLYLQDEFAVTFYAAFAERIRDVISTVYPDVAKECALPSRPVLGLRGSVVDSNHIRHQLVGGIQAARLIDQGLVPEIPFAESSLMHAELDRLGIFVNKQGTAFQRGERYCNRPRLEYVVYHKDAALPSGRKSRDVHYWYQNDHTSHRKELLGWGDQPGDVLLDMPVAQSVAKLRPMFEVTYLVRAGCEDELPVLSDDAVSQAFGAYKGGARTSLHGACAIRSFRPSPEDRVDWQPAHAVNLHVTMLRSAFDEKEASQANLSSGEDQFLSGFLRSVYPQQFVDICRGVSVVDCRLYQPDEEVVDQSGRQDRPRG